MALPIPDHSIGGSLHLLGLSPAEVVNRHWIGEIEDNFPSGEIRVGSLMDRFGKNIKSNSVRYEWRIRDYQTLQYAGIAAGTNSITGLGLILPAKARAQITDGLIIRNETTMELMHVMAVNHTVATANAVVVRRAAFGSTAGVILVGDWFTVVGNAHSEGSLAPGGMSTHLEQVYNYTQVVRCSWEVTGSAQADVRTEGYGPNLLDANRLEALRHKAKEIDMMFFTGQRHDSAVTGTQPLYEPNDWGTDMTWDSSNKPIRTTGGLDYFLTNYCPNNIIDALPAAAGRNTHFDIDMFRTGGDARGLSYENIINITEKIFETGGSSRLCICGPAVLTELQKFVTSSNVRFGKIETGRLGFNISELFTPHGTIYFATYQGFARLRGGWNKRAYFIDPRDIGRVSFRDLKVFPNIQELGSDMLKGSQLEEFGFRFTNPQANLRIDNFTVVPG